MSNSLETNLISSIIASEEMLEDNSIEVLKSYVIDEVKNSYIFQEIFNANGDIFYKLALEISNLFLQVLPQTATDWGLALWEKRVGITTNTSKSEEERRAKILAKLNTKGTTTVELIKQICKSFVSGVEIVQHNSEYYFEVNLLTNTGFPYALDSLYDSVEIAKPAHLGVKYKLTSLTQSGIYHGLEAITGETLTVYPWITSNIQTSGNIEVGISQDIGSESITIYPK